MEYKPHFANFVYSSTHNIITITETLLFDFIYGNEFYPMISQG